MSEPIIRLIGVKKSFDSQVVLDGVDIDIPASRTTVIAGGSGQGKSVTLKLILGLLKPDAGQILMEGRDIAMMKGRELRALRTNFGVLFQGAALLDSLSVFDNVALPLRERTKATEDEIRQKVLATLDQLGLADAENKFPAQLSGGMKKRVGLARALQLQPKVMLFDEPTTGLDPEKTMEIYHLFYQTQKQFGYTAVIVSHDIPKVFNLADQVIILNKGKAEVFVDPQDIQGSKSPEVHEFVMQTMGDVYLSREME
ncbi:MAG: ATP-binding cassette domain-containing protein [Deltaproteobacteria bacterium]|jgi:phospholipid/cholesterol/gamma-HCH transport system ATP-binding protein